MMKKLQADSYNNYHPERYEIDRCVTKAQYHYETAAMWAVKAATA